MPPTPSTFRSQVTSGLVTLIQTVQTAHPTLLIAVYASRPESLPDMPAAFVDILSERVRQTQGTRIRVISPSFVVVAKATPNLEAGAALDVLVDYLVDAVTDNPQFPATDTMHSGNFNIADEEFQIGGLFFPGVRFTLDDVTEMSGRT